MKKTLFVLLLIIGGTLSAQIEDRLKAGIHIGIPVGNAADYSGFNIGLDAAYMFWEPVDKLKIGAATGYTHFTGKNRNTYIGYPGFAYTVKLKTKDFGFIPVAAAGEYNLTEQFFVGTDIGFAISTNSDMDAGFYFQPKAGWNIKDFQAIAFVKGISSNSTLITLGVGGAYKF